MEKLMTAEEIVKSIQKTIVDWHKENENRPVDFEILTDEIKPVIVITPATIPAVMAVFALSIFFYLLVFTKSFLFCFI